MTPTPHNLAGDRSRGLGLLNLRLRAQMRTFLAIMLAAAAGALLAGGGTIALLCSRQVISVFLWRQFARLQIILFGNQNTIWRPWDPAVTWSNYQLVVDPYTQAATAAVHAAVRWAFPAAWAGAVLLAVFTAYTMRRIGAAARNQYRLRGQVLARDTALARQVRRRLYAGDLTIGRVPLIRNSETQHILMVGSPGTGKSQAIFHLLDRIRARGDTAVIYDIGGNYVPGFYRPEFGDTLLNPLDSRSERWSPWAELSHPAVADTLAAALIPAAPGPNQFWNDAARTIFATTLNLMARDPQRSILVMLRFMLTATRAEKHKAFAGTEAARFYEEAADRTAAGIDVTATNYIRTLRFLDAVSGDPKTDFSIRTFVNAVDTLAHSGAEPPWLFLTSRRDEHDALKPLISCWMNCAVSALLSMPERRDRRVWFILDELPTLQDLPALKHVLGEGRKYGACVVAGVQDINQIYNFYGRDLGAAMLSMFNSKAIYRVNTKESAEWASYILGEAEVERAEESARYGAAQSFDGLSLTTRRAMEKVVIGTDIMQLADLACYLKLPGQWPIAVTRIPDPARWYRHTIYVPFHAPDQDTSVAAALREAGIDPGEPAGASRPAPLRPNAPPSNQTAGQGELFGPPAPGPRPAGGSVPAPPASPPEKDTPSFPAEPTSPTSPPEAAPPQVKAPRPQGPTSPNSASIGNDKIPPSARPTSGIL